MRLIQGLVLVVAVVIIALRMWEIARSEEGMWTRYPHSGFCPDSRNYELRAFTPNYELENSAPTARGKRNER